MSKDNTNTSNAKCAKQANELIDKLLADMGFSWKKLNLPVKEKSVAEFVGSIAADSFRHCMSTSDKAMPRK